MPVCPRNTPLYTEGKQRFGESGSVDLEFRTWSVDGGLRGVPGRGRLPRLGYAARLRAAWTASQRWLPGSLTACTRCRLTPEPQASSSRVSHVLIRGLRCLAGRRVLSTLSLSLVCLITSGLIVFRSQSWRSPFRSQHCGWNSCRGEFSPGAHAVASAHGAADCCPLG